MVVIGIGIAVKKGAPCQVRILNSGQKSWRKIERGILRKGENLDDWVGK